MKILLAIIIGCIAAYFGYLLDAEIVSLIMDAVPKHSEWYGFVKLVAWLVVLFFTAGIIIYLSVAVAGLAFIIIDSIFDR